MGIYNRDYMRDDDPADWWKPGSSIKRWLTIGILAVSLLSSGLWLARNTGLWRWMHPKHEKLSLVVNINTATEAELATLPNIGTTRAKLIIDGRPYMSVDDLKKVSGISDKQIDSMRHFVKTIGRTDRIIRKGM